MVTNPNSSSAAPLQAESPTASVSHPPAAEAVGHLITATNRVIADAHVHGRRRVTTADWLMSRLHFAIARRLARLAYGFAIRGKGRMQ